jgi:UDP-N-acetyl-D-glucosamine dehydrogenase
MNTSLFQDKTAQVGIIGLGYVGLPLAVNFSKAGYNIVGIDLDESKVNMLNSGKSYIEDIEDRDLDLSKIMAVNDFSIIEKLDVVIICVPTPLDANHDPDLTFVESAARNVSRYAHKDLLIILESTVYPGTTKDFILPLLSESGLKVGEDFFLCFSPERVDPGRKDWTTFNTPKVIGGITESCLEAGHQFYSSALKTIVPVSSTEAAEMTKILENSFRAVNIGFINEMMKICDTMGLNIWEIVDTAASKPFGFMKFTPGPGVGGHCIPVDPLYLTWKMKQLGGDTEFISLAHKVNTDMPHYWVDKLEKELLKVNKRLKGSRIIVLGMSYKKDVTDYRESPSLDIYKILKERDAAVSYYDPFVANLKLAEDPLHSLENISEALKLADGVIIATDHTCFKELSLNDLDCPVINCRGMPLKKTSKEKVLVA